jgi:ADP-ribose pyrophosphatase
MPRKTYFHKGRIFDFVREKVTLPNGITKLYDFVKHRGAVVIIPLISRDKAIIIRQFRIAINRYIYELPAGSIEKGEKPSACAGRELIEETGYKARKIEYLGDIIPCPGYSTEILKIFKATSLTEVGHKNEEDEIIETIVVSRAQIRKMFKDGKILDAKTIASFAMIGWV